MCDLKFKCETLRRENRYGPFGASQETYPVMSGLSNSQLPQEKCPALLGVDGKAAVRCYVASIAHSKSFSELDTLENGIIFVEATSGTIVATFEIPNKLTSDRAECSGELRAFAESTLSARTFWTDVEIEIVEILNLFRDGGVLLPGFIDGHAHAPQYAFTGTGNDLPLLEWLQKYTFPVEAKFSDPEVARDVYSKAVDRHLRNGTTTCSYFATIHLEATKILVDEVRRAGQRAYVGLVNMDRNSPEYYVQTTEQSLADTKAFFKYVEDLADPRVTAVVTPRFVPSCTSKLMKGLGEIASENEAPVQSHLSETVNEVAWVKDLHPEASCYTDVYRAHGLLVGGKKGARANHKSYMAHCCQCGPLDRSILQESATGVIHCPNSNFSIGSGVLDVRRMRAEGVAVGLGTDVAGGYSCSILDAMRQARIASQVILFQERDERQRRSQAGDSGSSGGAAKPSPAPEEKSFTIAELLYLATAGGAEALGLQVGCRGSKLLHDLGCLLILCHCFARML